jgi:hypothetical protein
MFPCISGHLCETVFTKGLFICIHSHSPISDTLYILYTVDRAVHSAVNVWVFCIVLDTVDIASPDSEAVS